MANLKKDGYRFQKINDLIGRGIHSMQLKDDGVELDKLEKLGMYVLVNSEEVYGAVGILDKDFVKKFAEDRDFYILPSSLHETIFVCADKWCNPRGLDTMIKEINTDVFDKQDILTDHCYFYDSSKN